MPPRTPAHVRVIDRLLADCCWHALEDVMSEAVGAVPPGVAYRAGERSRQGQRERAGRGRAPRRDGNREHTISTGARLIVRDSIWARCKTGAWEQREVSGVRQLRLGRTVVRVGEVPPWMVAAGRETFRLLEPTR